MTDPITIRPYDSADFDWLVDLHGTYYAEAEGFDDSFGRLVASILTEFHQMQDPAREQGWILQRGERRLGSIFCVRVDDRTAKLRLFILAPEARGMGLGAQLLGTCTGFAKDKGYTRMVLWTHESHAAACALYRRTGWTCTASKPVHSFGVDLVEQAWEVTF